MINLLSNIKLKVISLLGENKKLKEQIAHNQLIEANLKRQIQDLQQQITQLQNANKLDNMAHQLSLTDVEKSQLDSQLKRYINYLNRCIRMLSE
jgi:phage gp36-like protein